MGPYDIFLGFLALLFPPFAVWVKRGICSADSIINICLCVLGVLPGLLHAWYIIAKFPDEGWSDYERLHREGGGGERGERVTYVYTAVPQQQQHSGMNYGTAQPQQEGRTQAGPSAGPAAGSSSSPPTYAEAVKGDNKIQTQD